MHKDQRWAGKYGFLEVEAMVGWGGGGGYGIFGGRGAGRNCVR